MAATAERRLARVTEDEPLDPRRILCADCRLPVLEVVILGEIFIADPHEWEPRAHCPVCGTPGVCRFCGVPFDTGASELRRYHVRCRDKAYEARRKGGHVCNRCGGEGYVGETRPQEPMIAFDFAWSDGGHARLIGPRTNRMRGEALFRLHTCPMG